MKRFYIEKAVDVERGVMYSAYELNGVNEFNEDQWDYVEGTMSFTRAEAIEALKYERDNVNDKDIES